MEREELQKLLPNFEELQKQIKESVPSKNQEDIQKQLNPAEHDVMKNEKRPDKIVTTDNGPKTVPVSRIPISMQKKIVRYAAAFLCGNPILLNATIPEGDQLLADLYNLVQRTWDDNKLDYESLNLAKFLMSETEVAEIWFPVPADPMYWAGTALEGKNLRYRMRIVAPSLGDKLYPVFDYAGDLIAFGREFQQTIEGKKVDCFDVYTETQIYKGTKGDSGFTVVTEANPVGKIQVIYYSQLQPEWADVQDAIGRLETVVSNLGDTNDYFGSPMVFVQGEVEGFATKGEQGKVLIGKNGGKAEYLTWDQSPESTKLEYEILNAIIHEQTETPNISFEQMKGLGTFSGFALKMLFMSAHMKAAEHERGAFGKGIQRRINFLKAALAKIDTKFEKATGLPIKPKFEYFLPKNEAEIIDMLNVATGNKPVLSQESAVALNPLVTDAAAELEKIKAQSSSEDPLGNEFN